MSGGDVLGDAGVPVDDVVGQARAVDGVNGDGGPGGGQIRGEGRRRADRERIADDQNLLHYGSGRDGVGAALGGERMDVDAGGIGPGHQGRLRAHGAGHVGDVDLEVEVGAARAGRHDVSAPARQHDQLPGRHPLARRHQVRGSVAVRIGGPVVAGHDDAVATIAAGVRRRHHP